MRLSEAQAIIADYSYAQQGLVTSAQALSEGIDSTTLTRLTQKGALYRVRRGVYLLASVGETPTTDVRAAWLATEPETLAEERLKADDPIVISHESATSLWEVGDLIPSKHTFTRATRKQSSAPDIAHRTAPLSADDWTLVDGLPVTTLIRTITDLARDRLDGDYLYRIITDAIYNHHESPARIAEELDHYARFYGFSSGHRFVEEALVAFPEPQSVTEIHDFGALQRLSAFKLPDFGQYMEKIRLKPPEDLSRIIAEANRAVLPMDERVKAQMRQVMRFPEYSALQAVKSDLDKSLQEKIHKVMRDCHRTR